MTKLFSKEPVNRGRQIELDLAKCLAIIFMIFLHTMTVASGFANNISVPMERAIYQLLGRPFAAPVFMFAMGIGMIYSKHQEPAYLMKRGVKLMLLGIVVNVGEYILPHFLAGKLLGEWDIFPIANGLLLFCVDILAFAGMAMILIGALKKLKLESWQMVVIAVALSVIASFVRFHNFGSDIWNLITGYFVGSLRDNGTAFTAFPLFHWFIFPAAGMLFGEWYIRCNNKKKLLCLWPLGLAISVIYFVMHWSAPKGFICSEDVHYYYDMTTIDAFVCLICIYGVIGLCYFISLILPNSVKGFISKTSGNVNAIYVTQWFIIPLTFIFICYFNRNVKFNDISFIIIAIIEVVASTAIAAGYKYVLKKGKGKNVEEK